MAFFLTEVSASRYNSTSFRSVAETFMDDPEEPEEVVLRVVLFVVVFFEDVEEVFL